MTTQEFDKIVVRYEEHKQECERQYVLGKLHGALEVMTICCRHGFGYPLAVEQHVAKLLKKI